MPRLRRVAGSLIAVLVAGCIAPGGVPEQGYQRPGGDGPDDNGDRPDAWFSEGKVDGGSDNEFIDAAVCEQSVPIVVERKQDRPDLLLIVDKSGSMIGPLDFFNPFMSKWDVMRGTLSKVVGEREDTINFGLMLFPDGSVCGGASLKVDVGPNNGDEIKGALNGSFPDGDTPTDQAMRDALAYYDSIPVNPFGRYALLATDGLPNCIDPADPEAVTPGPAIDAIGELAAAGIQTFVLGFGGGIDVDHATLQDMATAGGTGSAYQADSAVDLAAELNTISGLVSIPSCTYALTSTPPDPKKVGITFDGVPVPMSPSHVTGWDYNAADNTINFYGDSCVTLQSGSVEEVHVDYGCGGPIIG